MLNIMTDLMFKLEMVLKGSKIDPTFGRVDAAKKLVEDTLNKVRELRTDERYSKAWAEGEIRRTVSNARDQLKLLKSATDAEYEKVHNALKQKMHGNGAKSEMRELIDLIKAERIRSVIKDDLVEFIAKNPKALEDSDIMDAIVNDPAKVLPLQMGQLHDKQDSGLDIQRLHLQKKNPEVFAELEQSESRQLTATAVYSSIAGSIDELIGDSVQTKLDDSIEIL